MKKLIAIFLLFQFISNNTFGEELIKLPKLFIHYQHHSNEHKDTKGFADFLKNHYSNSPEKNEHQGEDNDCGLPFKHCNDCCMASHAPLVAHMPLTSKSYFYAVATPVKNITPLIVKIQSISGPTVWQPPKK